MPLYWALTQLWQNEVVICMAWCAREIFNTVKHVAAIESMNWFRWLMTEKCTKLVIPLSPHTANNLLSLSTFIVLTALFSFVFHRIIQNMFRAYRNCVYLCMNSVIIHQPYILHILVWSMENLLVGYSKAFDLHMQSGQVNDVWTWGPFKKPPCNSNPIF